MNKRWSSILWKLVLVVAVLMIGGVAFGKWWLHKQYENGHWKGDAKARCRMLETAIDAYNMKNGKNPESLDDLKDFLKGGEIPETPWRGKYFYSPTSTNEGFTYEIWCVAPDGTRVGNTTLSRRPVSSR